MSLKRPKSALLKSRIVSLLCTLLTALSSKDLELHHFMVTAAKAALDLHVSHQSLLVDENKVQHSTSLCWISYHLEKEAIINAFQEPPGLLMPCCVVPTDIIVAEVPHEDQACEGEADPVYLQRASSTWSSWLGGL